MNRTRYLLLWALLLSPPAWGEPYLAAREGFKCVQCHLNPTGGGMRNAFGNAYAQTRLAAETLATPGVEFWSNALDNLVSLGGDLRTAATYLSTPHQKDRNAFETQELRLYFLANIIPERLALYADQRLLPGGSRTLEAYGRLWFWNNHFYLKAGQMYLPYGLRLEDDEAYIRMVPGINFTTPDNGAELGYEQDSWTLQLAVSNGAASAPEADNGKQFSLRAEYVRPVWRLGASANFNDTAAGQRHMQNVFAGLRTGPLAWLAEADYIRDDSFTGGERGLWAGLLETNWGFRQGHNLKLTSEYFDPDEDVKEDEQSRYSGIYEYTPIQFLQLRLGARFYDGIPQNDFQNRRAGFLELHAYF